MARRWRLIAASFLIICSLMAAICPALAQAATVSAPGLYVPSAILVSPEGNVLWSKKPDDPRRVASTTKLLTALVVRDAAQLDTTITVAPKAASVDDGAVGLKAGEKLTVRQLLAVMLVHSANGAAEALAIGIAGNEKNFVAMMYAKAKSLGLKHTHPADPHGLSPKGTSSAADLAVITRQFMADPVLRAIVRQSSAWLPNGGFGTTNRMLRSYRGMEGVKTGYTDPAGYCFVGEAKRNGVELIGVVLGADESNDRFTQMSKLLDWGYAHARPEEIVSRDTTMGAIEIQSGMEPTVTVHAEKPLTMTLLDSGGAVTTQVSLPPSVPAPVVAGQTLGAVQLSQNGVLVASVPLVADASVGRKAQTPLGLHFGGATSGGSGTGFWRQVALVWAGLGRMLGI